MTILMTPDKTNFFGNVHGGDVLELLDQVAYACASRYAGRHVVTLSVDQVTFRQPIHVGELLTRIAALPPGVPAKLDVVRRNQALSLEVTPTQRAKNKAVPR